MGTWVNQISFYYNTAKNVFVPVTERAADMSIGSVAGICANI